MSTAQTQKTPPTALDPVQVLRQVYLDRKAQNPSYSTRAFARDLGISQTLLSLIFNRKRPLTLKQGTQIAALLRLPLERSQVWIESVAAAASQFAEARGAISRKSIRVTDRSPFYNLDVETFKTISQWYHLAILDLTTTQGFSSDPQWIADRLQISKLEAEDAIERLLRVGLMSQGEDGSLHKSQRKIHFSSRKSKSAVRCFHRQMFERASTEMDKADPADFDRREISGLTLAIKASRIEYAKKRIQEFQKSLALELAEGDDCDEVYHLALQFFPLTQTQKPRSNEK